MICNKSEINFCEVSSPVTSHVDLYCSRSQAIWWCDGVTALVWRTQRPGPYGALVLSQMEGSLSLTYFYSLRVMLWLDGKLCLEWYYHGNNRKWSSRCVTNLVTHLPRQQASVNCDPDGLCATSGTKWPRQLPPLILVAACCLQSVISSFSHLARTLHL